MTLGTANSGIIVERDTSLISAYYLIVKKTAKQGIQDYVEWRTSANFLRKEFVLTSMLLLPMMMELKKRINI